MYRVIRTCSRRRLYCNKAVNGGSTETSRVNGGVNESSGGCGAGGLGVNGSSCSGGSEAVGVKGSSSGAIHRVKAGAGGRGVVAMGELMGVGVIIVVMAIWVLIMGVMVVVMGVGLMDGLRGWIG